MNSKILCFGELLVRLSAPNHLKLQQANNLDFQFTGAEANVAVALAQFGLAASFTTCLPDNEIGRLGLSTLRKYNVDTSSCVFGGERLGLFYFEMGIGQRSSKVLYDRSYSSMALIKKGEIDWSKVMEGITWFHWSGITPAISQEAADATLEALKAAKERNITISCDLNYRASLWNYGKHPSEIMPELLQYCHLMVGDSETINTYFGIKEINNEMLALQTFKTFSNLQNIALTIRKSIHASHNTYQGILFNHSNSFASKEFDIVDILDRLGTGDAFTAGLIYTLQSAETSGQYAIDFATAAATLKHTIYGDFNLLNVKEIDDLIKGNTGGRVIR
jgi:2-dehydro-3-deoxygluconokinase